MSCNGHIRIPLPTKQRNRHSSRIDVGKTGLFLSCGRKLSFPLKWVRYLRKLLGFHKRFQVPFQVPRGNVGFLGKRCSVKGPHLVWRGEFHGFFGVVLGSLGFLSSCMGTWGTRSCFLRKVRSAFELRRAPQDSSHVTVGMNRASSRVEEGTSEILSISDIHLEVSVEFEQGRQDSSYLQTLSLACLLSCE